MPDITHDDADDEQYDLDIRVPGVAFDIGQPGFPKVLVVQRISATVNEYDDKRPDDAKGQQAYVKNAIVRTSERDAVYQCVYLPDGPLSGGDLNDPSTRYPVPESRLVPLRAERADPVDDTSTFSPREAVRADLLEALFDVCYAFEDAPDPSDLGTVAEHAGVQLSLVAVARDAARAHAADDAEPLTMNEETAVDVDDSTLNMTLTDADADDDE